MQGYEFWCSVGIWSTVNRPDRGWNDLIAFRALLLENRIFSLSGFLFIDNFNVFQSFYVFALLKYRVSLEAELKELRCKTLKNALESLRGREYFVLK